MPLDIYSTRCGRTECVPAHVDVVLNLAVEEVRHWLGVHRLPTIHIVDNIKFLPAKLLVDALRAGSVPRNVARGSCAPLELFIRLARQRRQRSLAAVKKSYLMTSVQQPTNLIHRRGETHWSYTARGSVLNSLLFPEVKSAKASTANNKYILRRAHGERMSSSEGGKQEKEGAKHHHRL